MNREILFRGQRADNKEWVYGQYLTEVGRGVADSNNDLIHFIKNNFGTQTIIPKTLGQFTGLSDKNKVKIFEGDRIKSGKFEYYIAFENGAFYAYHTSLKDCMGYPYRWGLANRFEDIGLEFEVIGDIHDTPELLTNKIGE